MRPVLFVLAVSVSCGTPAEKSTQKSAPEPTPTPAEPKPEPPAPVEAPAPAPLPGTAVDGKLMIQTCADTHPCPDLLQTEGEKGCSEIEISGTQDWRLPTKAEAERFARVEGLLELEGYHWTSTPFEEDDKQVWIIDPKSNQPTTVPRDRKPFRIRCVRDI